ncbi:substrate-binding domain-containing protein [Streptomyces coeruleoprunus]|uniref:Substrate-binding domain-containing protein n=1 Tax=Streptomyces coeruleoprunus TaxID=285563 RepID=A0ABV9XBJ1_9ACTN
MGCSSGVYRRHAGYAERTLDGFRERAELRGLRFVHRPCEGTYDSAAATLGRILADRPDTTGFVVQNEGAIGPLLGLLRAGGRTVPEDVSVVAVCPAAPAEQHAPRLTVVTAPSKELGQLAVDQAMARIAAMAEGHEPEDELVLMPPELVVRESTAAPPRRGARRAERP